MELHTENYYHLYNRSNNNEIVFKSADNYNYFLSKYIKYCSSEVDTIAYCLMPTHFHFLIFVKTNDTDRLKENLGIMLSSYTKAINKKFSRHGSLFQEHTKSRCVERDKYLLSVLNYIHQNPVRAKLVKRLEDWEYSSYRDYIGLLDGGHLRGELHLTDAHLQGGFQLKDGHHLLQLKKDIVLSYFSGVEEFKRYSNEMTETDEKKYGF